MIWRSKFPDQRQPLHPKRYRISSYNSNITPRQHCNQKKWQQPPPGHTCRYRTRSVHRAAAQSASSGNWSRLKLIIRKKSQSLMPFFLLFFFDFFINIHVNAREVRMRRGEVTARASLLPSTAALVHSAPTRWWVLWKEVSPEACIFIRHGPLLAKMRTVCELLLWTLRLKVQPLTSFIWNTKHEVGLMQPPKAHWKLQLSRT